MKSNVGAVVAMGLVAAALSVSAAVAQECGTTPGMMIKYDSDAWSYETAYDRATLMSTSGSMLTVVGTVSLFCAPFTDLNPADPSTEYTFIWDGLTSLGTATRTLGSSFRYTTKYVGGSFRIYAGSPRNAPTAATLPALPAAGVVPDAFADGTMILGGAMDTLVVIYTRSSIGSYTGSLLANYWATGGTLYDRVGPAISLMTGAWCIAPPSGNPGGTCALPTGWSAHQNGKWDMPLTVPALPSTWGKIKNIYR